MRLIILLWSIWVDYQVSLIWISCCKNGRRGTWIIINPSKLSHLFLRPLLCTFSSYTSLPFVSFFSSRSSSSMSSLATSPTDYAPIVLLSSRSLSTSERSKLFIWVRPILFFFFLKKKQRKKGAKKKKEWNIKSENRLQEKTKRAFLNTRVLHQRRKLQKKK